MKSLLSILLTLLLSTANAQDYAAVYTNQFVHFYEDTAVSYNYGLQYPQINIIGLRTDSFQLSSNDTLIHAYQSKPTTASLTLCDTADIAKQGELILKQNHRTVFINDQGDSIQFNHDISVNSNWKLCDLTNGESLRSKVYKKLTQSVGSVVDTVAYLAIYQADSNGRGIFNGHKDTLRLSKSYGLLDFKIWRDFPLNNQNIDFLRIKIEVPTKREIFDFNIGDEFHYMKSYGAAPLTPPSHANIIILNKWSSLANDTIFYERHVIEEDRNLNIHTVPPTVIYNRRQFYDTIYFTELDKKMIDAVVGEIHYNNLDYYQFKQAGYMIHLYPKNQVAQRRMLSVDYNMYYDTSMNCYRYASFVEGYIFGEGLGLCQAYERYTGTGQTIQNTLIYYSKGSEVYGTPYNIAIGLNEESEDQSKVKLFPNPAKGQISIQGIQANSRLWIYDLSGKLKQHSTISSNSTIDVSQLEAGLYLIQIESEGEMVRKKLVKK